MAAAEPKEEPKDEPEVELEAADKADTEVCKVTVVGVSDDVSCSMAV